MYFWRVYRRRLCYIKTKLDEAENTIYITGADDQSHADNVGQTDTGISTYTAFHDQ